MPLLTITEDLTTLGATVGTGWQPRFRDESLVEWLIVMCYFATAILCVRARRVVRFGLDRSFEFRGYDRRGADRSGAYVACARFWGLLFALFIFLGINKRLDLQSALTHLARDLSRDMGWYDERRLIQFALVAIIAGCGIAGFGVLLWLARRIMPRLVLAFFGTVLLAVFLLSKASSYHHLDAVLHFEIMGVRVYQPLELAGIVCVALCAVLNCWWHDARALVALLRGRSSPA
ncbi:MAG: hypothetical protein RIB32_00795 [Phycisphaerales bacterium]